MQDVSASKKPEKEVPKGQAGNIKARFEKMGAQESEVCECIVWEMGGGEEERMGERGREWEKREGVGEEGGSGRRGREWEKREGVGEEGGSGRRGREWEKREGVGEEGGSGRKREGVGEEGGSGRRGREWEKEGGSGRRGRDEGEWAEGVLNFGSVWLFGGYNYL